MDVIDQVSMALACSALDPQLAGLLFLDLDPALIFPLGGWLARLVEDEAPVFSLGPRLAEEALWEEIEPRYDAEDREGVEFRWKAGPLAGYSRQAGIVLVPDLALLSLPAARAAVTLIGADVAHLERSGMSATWHPRDRWLAALRRQDADRVAPHLLDRFSLRVNAAALALPRQGGPVLPAPDPAWARAVRAARQGASLPVLSAAAADRVVASVPPGAPGARRDLALGRVARALAGLAGEPTVQPGHVDHAAELAGLGAVTGRPGSRRNGAAASGGVTTWTPGQDTETDASQAADPVTPEPVTPGPDTVGPAATEPTSWPDTVNGHVEAVPGEPESLPPEPADDGFARPEGAMPTQPNGPYPEDEAEPRRDADPLRIGWQQRALAGPPRGHPIGIQQARNTRDIAVTATLLQAAKYQRVRRRRPSRPGRSLLVLKADLRSYRRAAQPGHLLVLLLDHTCRGQDWDWYEPMGPYLGWAYVTRAAVGVVEVGTSADAADGELRATQFQSRSVLDPRVANALERPPGRATPLAHGLTLAAGMLRHSLQQSGARVSEAILVVITDGRANVSLAASQTGALPARVGGDAVRDALGAASEIRAIRAVSALHQVRSVVIDPGPRPYGHLTARLAEALGAPLMHGTSMVAIPLPVSGTA